jgi:hypothetical protein
LRRVISRFTDACAEQGSHELQKEIQNEIKIGLSEKD